MNLYSNKINSLDKSKVFIIDEETYNIILDNNNYGINQSKCDCCNNKLIIRYFAECCYEFEDEICDNMRDRKNIYLPKSDNHGIYLFFEDDTIINLYKVKSSYDFINTSIKNIFLNNPFCNNMYYHVYHVLTKGKEFKILDDDKTYIKVYIDLKPSAKHLFVKKDKTRFIYK